MATGNHPVKPGYQPRTAPAKVVQLKGEAYQGLNISGNAYAKVHTRVESAHKNGGYTVLSCEFKEIFEMRVCEVWIELPNGQRFPGTAELKPKTATFTASLEDAQTSAIGRALAFAGFNVETAIASQEDMQSVLQERNISIVESEPAALPAPSIPLPEGKTWKEYACELAETARATKDGFLAEVKRLTGEDISKTKLNEAGWEVVACHFYPLAKVMAEQSLPPGA